MKGGSSAGRAFSSFISLSDASSALLCVKDRLCGTKSEQSGFSLVLVPPGDEVQGSTVRSSGF